MSAADWVITITCPWCERARCRIATPRAAAMWITAPNSSSISVHGAPARPAAACRSESASTVIAAASSGMSSA